MPNWALGLRILVVCRNCGFKLHDYNPYAKAKFSGVPNPKQTIRIYSYTCPACGAELQNPTIKFMTRKDYTERYQESEYFIYEKG